MRLGARVAVFGYPLAELLAAMLVASWIGWGWTLLLVIAGVPAGMAIMRNAGEASFNAMRVAARTGHLPADAGGSHALQFLAGLLIAVPGFITDVAGLVLLLPPVQQMVGRRIGARIVVAGGGAAFASGDVIPGDVIPGDVVPGDVVAEDGRTDDQRADDGRGGADDPVIRGVIVNPPKTDMPKTSPTDDEPR